MTPDLSDEALDALDEDLLQWCEQWAPDLDSKVGQVRAAIRGLREELINARESIEHCMTCHSIDWKERAERAEAPLATVQRAHGRLREECSGLEAERDRLRAALEEIVKTHGFDSVTCARRALAKP
jgi:chromosome segregation ATPase